MSFRLRYGSPARRWLEALSIGNGRLAAMVHGSVTGLKACGNVTVDVEWTPDRATTRLRPQVGGPLVIFHPCTSVLTGTKCRAAPAKRTS
ncbi:MAG: glycoside hydrolase N-terminal domain-containing protein [Mycobacterium sp.]|nr:glycoside hydrolase N-terminal domain-containing protein [Mycobacterium sp.]